MQLVWDLILPLAPGWKLVALSHSANLIPLITEINSKGGTHDPSQASQGQENSLQGFYLKYQEERLCLLVEVPGSMWLGAASP